MIRTRKTRRLESTCVSRRFLAFVLLALATPLDVTGDEKPLTVTIDQLIGGRSTATFEELTTDGLRVRTTTVKTIPRSRLFRVDFPKQKSTLANSYIHLTSGERLAIAASKSDGEDLQGVWSTLPGKPKIKIPLLYVRGLIHQRSEQQRRWTPTTVFRKGQKLDLILLANGDKVTGRLKSINEKSIKMRNATGVIARSTVVAVAFDPRFLDKPKTPVERILVALRDGSRFTASRVVSAQTNLAIETHWGAKVTVPIGQVESLVFLGKRAEPLSVRTPASAVHTPYIAGRRSPQINRNVLGGRLRLHGRDYVIGLGMSTRTRIEYALRGDENYFRATLGVDDAAKGRGSVIFRVELDGKTVFKSQVLTGKSKPLKLKPIPVKGVKQLALIADFGPRGDLLDYANWCDAILIR